MLRLAFVVLAVLALAGCGSDEVVRDSGDGAVEGPASMTPAERWWNALTAEQMVAALYGDEATAEQAEAAENMYADLDDDTRALVDAATEEIYDKSATYDSAGEWWETLDCRLMRVAAGDGITADPMSPYCRHYPGYMFPFEKVLTPKYLRHVNEIGAALLDYDLMDYTPADMAAFDELVEGMTVVFTYDDPQAREGLEAVPVFNVAFTEPGRGYSFGDPNYPGKFPVNYTWEHLGDDTDAGRLTIWWDPDDPGASLSQNEMVFLGMRDGVFWADYSEGGESVTMATGTFEFAETDEDAN